MGMMKQLDVALQELIHLYGRTMVATAVAGLLACECKRCNNTWTPRGAARPEMCPRCKSRLWDTERGER